MVAIFAWRGTTGAAMGTLVSSKINQWTLLVGMLPVVYGISLGAIEPLMLSGRQNRELILTVAQTFFAVLIMLDLRLHCYGGLTLFALFVAGFISPAHHVTLSSMYVVLGMVAGIYRRREIREVVRYVRRMNVGASGR